LVVNLSHHTPLRAELNGTFARGAVRKVDDLKTCLFPRVAARLIALMAEPFNYVVVSRKRPRDMRYATRTAAIFVGEVQEQTAFQREMTDALSFCFLGFMSKRERNFITCIIAGEMAENFHRYLCPQIISLPFRREYRGAISAHADSVCHAEFRFNKMQLRRLHISLRLDGDHRLDNGAKYSGETILLASLFYMHRPMTQEECADFIGITCQPDVSRIYSFFLEHMITNWDHLVAIDPFDSLNMWAPFVPEFKRRIMLYHVRGVDTFRYRNVIGFVDGKLHRVARPLQRPEHTEIRVDTQQTVYNGYKKIHAVKFQSVIAPNGMIIQLSGAYRGRVHDSTLLRRSGLNSMLQQLSASAGEHCDVYGDSAYPILSNVVKAYGSRQVKPNTGASYLLKK
jgi:hypothetical protein